MLDVTADFRDLERALSDSAQRQLPFAIMMAINDTAQDVKRAQERQMDRLLDRPTPYTKRGVFVRRANKTTLTATIGIKDRQAQYLRWQVHGGVRRPTRKALVIGAALRRNKYGNLPRNAVARVEAKPNTFVAKRRGGRGRLRPGIYERSKSRNGERKLKMLVSFQPLAKYRKRFPFYQTANRTATAAIESHLAFRMREALRTAK